MNATHGFEVVGEAETGEESVAAAGRLHPDLVLMDVNLPGIDGLEASRRIRAAHPKVTVLPLSTYDPEEFAARIAGSGAIAFISKAAFGPDGLTKICGPRLTVWVQVEGSRTRSCGGSRY